MSAKGTLLGPLTTTWTMPASCSVLYPAEAGTSTVIGYRGQSCNQGGYILDNSHCWPPRKDGVADASPGFLGWGFYSPGVVCPAGYVTACTAVWQQRPDWDIQFSLFTGETAIGCCPTGYACTNWSGQGNTCYAVPTETILSTAACGTDGRISNEGPYTWPATVSLQMPGNVSATIATVWAPMFQLNFRSTDITTASTGSRSAATPSSTSSGAPGTTSTGAASTSLSKGAIAGIAVGAAIGAVLLCVGAFIILRRYRRRRTTSNTLDQADGLHDKRSNAAMSWQGRRQGGQGAHSVVPQEMPAGPNPVELPVERTH